MDIKNLDLVNKLVEARRKCVFAITETRNYITGLESDESTRSKETENPVLSGGYYGHISEHYDGSGSRVDLNGCYVGSAVLHATMSILDDKMTAIDKELKALGVEG